MTVLFIRGESRAMLIPFRRSGRRSSSITESLMQGQSSASASTISSSRHVVIVMDGIKEFTTEPLEWALKNIAPAGCTLTLLGAMPWLNIPLSSKTSQDVWAAELEDLISAEEKTEWKGSDAKFARLQAVVALCEKYGVVPQKEVVMGFPLRLLVVEKITSLHATWVVFDRHQRKNKEFFAERIPCNLVMMNTNGEGDLIRGRPTIESAWSTPAESPASSVPSPQPIVFDDYWRERLNINESQQ